MQNNLRRNMKSLCFSGCSLTNGGLVALSNIFEQRYSRLVSNHYGITENNISKGGASNDDIVNRSINYLENNTVDIFVIQFTYVDRCKWFDWNGNHHGWRPFMREDKTPHKTWYKYVYTKYLGLENAYKNMHLFDLYCKSRKQKYIPFVAEHVYDYDSDCNWKKIYKCNPTRIYPTGLFPLTKDKHPNAEENREMAKIVIGKIDELIV